MAGSGEINVLALLPGARVVSRRKLHKCEPPAKAIDLLRRKISFRHHAHSYRDSYHPLADHAQMIGPEEWTKIYPRRGRLLREISYRSYPLTGGEYRISAQWFRKIGRELGSQAEPVSTAFYRRSQREVRYKNIELQRTLLVVPRDQFRPDPVVLDAPGKLSAPVRFIQRAQGQDDS